MSPTVKVRNIHERWNSGEQAVFDYSLPNDPTSEIAARLHHRTGQIVTVLGEAEHDGTEPTFVERADAGAPIVYTIRFPDGHEDTAFEDEVLDLDQPYIEEPA